MAEVISRTAEGELAYRTGEQWYTIPEGVHTRSVTDELDTIDRELAVYRLTKERHVLRNSIINACQHRIQRQILSTVVLWEGIVMYDRLYDCVNAGESQIRDHVKILVDSGVLRREGNPAVISIVDTDVSLMVEDELHTTDTVTTDEHTEPLNDNRAADGHEPTTPTPTVPSTPPPPSNSEQPPTD